MTVFTVADIDHSLVREFSKGGDTFGPNSSREYRREKMRVAILTAGKEGRAFYDSGMTYAEAYRRCYGAPLEQRGMAALTIPDVLTEHLDNDDDDE